MKQLNLNWCSQLTDDIGNSLRELKNLEILCLWCTNITDDIGLSLQQLPKLRRLELRACIHLTDWIGHYLAKLWNLETLDINECQNITEEIKTMLEKPPNYPSLFNLERPEHPFQARPSDPRRKRYCCFSFFKNL